MQNTPSKEPCILGIDPGTQITGFGVIKVLSSKLIPIDFGTIRPSKELPLEKKFLIIFKGVEKLIDQYKPTALSIETQFVKLNVQVAMKLGMVRGVVILASTLYDIPIFEYAPRKAKIAVAGNGAASKTQVQRMIQILLNLKSLPKPQDASDALAIAICHANQLNRLGQTCMNT